jgi:uncharacterized sulfatase
VWRGEPAAIELLTRPLLWHFPYYHPETNFAAARAAIGVDDFAVSQTRPHAALRLGDWKLLHSFEDARDELYHLGRDPAEQTNLAAREPARTRELRRRLDAALEEAGARRPTRADP